jgi:uncharacterized protein (DUF427 family)
MTSTNPPALEYRKLCIYAEENAMKAIWNDTVLAESEDLVEVEGNYYFPKGSINCEFFEESDHHTFCPWKGTASYYSIKAGGATNENAAWYYPEPKPDAHIIADRIAFWKGVEVKA